MILYYVNNSSSVHADNRNKNILIFGKDSADRLNEIRITTAKHKKNKLLISLI